MLRIGVFLLFSDRFCSTYGVLRGVEDHPERELTVIS